MSNSTKRIVEIRTSCGNFEIEDSQSDFQTRFSAFMRALNSKEESFISLRDFFPLSEDWANAVLIRAQSIQHVYVYGENISIKNHKERLLENE